MSVRKLLPLPDEFKLGRRAFGFMDHMDHLVDADRWTKIATDSGTLVVGDAQGGILTITPSDGSVADNDEAYLHTTNELFIFDADRPMMCEALIQYSEANTDDANIMFGFVSGAGANSIQDNGAGPPASYSGAVIHKVDGGTKWVCESSVGATQTTETSDETAGGATFQRLRIEVHTGRGTNKVDIAFFIDEQQARENNSNLPSQRVILHEDVDISSATEMTVFIGAKNGDANGEALLVKYIAAYQLY
jgi:hypothetical protein